MEFFLCCMCLLLHSSNFILCALLGNRGMQIYCLIVYAIRRTIYFILQLLSMMYYNEIYKNR